MGKTGVAKGGAQPAAKPAKPGAVPDAALQFLEYYYPIHYKAGIGLEDALRDGLLSRHQVAILWLIHSEGTGARRMNRKAIERSLASWFEISGAAITKALRSMAQPPLELVRLEEDPRSGREKIVSLTPKGEAHMARMIAGGEAFVQRIIDEMSEEEVVQGLHFFRRISEIVEGFR
ncbi:MarR family winged helix-turn-helix transcriptional regulator [Tepidicaulis sp. LMO-SS28]|uniref:MarR family winged helix-turn-helix transcriptional regulator n=1 Tax=Tepidicaulis sp. LMO-SS28 TaxID=3447455 RepID=UPI003EE222BB